MGGGRLKREYRTKKERGVKKADEIKRRLQVTERELRHLIESQWFYAKRMLKFGFATWIFGISTFFSSIVMINSKLLGMTPSISIFLLVAALAAPVVVTAVLVRKFAIKIKRLERIRVVLLAEYERTVLKRVEKIVSR